MASTVEKANDYFKLLLQHAQNYHGQKERMSHAAFLLQLALGGAVMTFDQWPPKWLPSEQGALWVILGLWFAVHGFMRWQLRLRRWAAIRYATVNKLLGSWISHSYRRLPLSFAGEIPAENEGERRGAKR